VQAEAEPPQEADTVEDQNNSLVAPLPSEDGGLPAPDAAASPQHQQGALLGHLMLPLTPISAACCVLALSQCRLSAMPPERARSRSASKTTSGMIFLGPY